MSTLNSTLPDQTGLSKMENAGIWIYEKINNSRLLIGIIVMVILTAISMRMNYIQGKWTANDPDSMMLLPTGYASLDGSLLFLLAMIVVGIHYKPLLYAAISWSFILICLSLWSSFSFTIAVDEKGQVDAKNDRLAQLADNLKIADTRVKKWEKKSSETSLWSTSYDEKETTAIIARDKIQDEITILKNINSPAALAAFKKVEVITGGFILEETARIVIRFFWSVAMVITPLLIVLIFTSEMKYLFLNKKKTDITADTPENIDTPNKKNNVVDINVNTPGGAESHVITQEFKKRVRAMGKSDQYLVAKNAVLAGHNPSHKSIKELGIGSDFSQEFLGKLRDELIIERNGRGHKRVSN